VAVDASTTIIGPREPLDGEVDIEKVMESPSGSEPLRVTCTAVSSEVARLVLVAVGWVLRVVAVVSVETQDSLPSESYADTAV
jgi:hypothetical protein